LADAAGVSSNELTGDNIHDLEVLYAKMAGITTDEIADGLKGDSEKLLKEISKMQAAKEAGEEADKVYQNMLKLDEKA
jgi:predicted transcriptional regulator